jgi:hypothetical protein
MAVSYYFCLFSPAGRVLARSSCSLLLPVPQPTAHSYQLQLQPPAICKCLDYYAACEYWNWMDRLSVLSSDSTAVVCSFGWWLMADADLL